VIPSGEEDAIVPDVFDTATKSPLPYPTPYHAVVADMVLAVQVMPSTEVAETLEPVATATNTPLPKVTALQPAEGMVLEVHVMPSGLEAATVALPPTATKMPLP
jgi:hypothetical protein